VDIDVFNRIESKVPSHGVVLVYIPSKKRRLPALIENVYALLKDVRIDVTIFGEDLSSPKIPSLGSLSQIDCQKMYNDHKCGVVFSASNPSRMSLEMGACGLPVIELDAENNFWDVPNSVFAKLTDPELIVDKIQSYINLDYESWKNKSIATAKFCQSRKISDEASDFANIISP
jgi:hypothetical protein